MTEDNFRHKRPFWGQIGWILLFLCLISFLLRLINIDAFSFWTDEGLTPLRASYPFAEILSNRIIIQQGVTTDTHPPLFYAIIHFTRQIFGETDFAYRYPSLLASVLLVPLMYQLGRLLNGRFLGIMAALLTSINPLHIWYANEARMYAILILLMAGASFTLLRVLRHPEGQPLIRRLVQYTVLAGMALYTVYTAVFLIAAQGLLWGWILWKRGQRRLIAGTAVLGILIAIPLIPVTIPRLLRGVEANFFLVSPRIMLQDVIRFFYLGLTVNFESVPIVLLAFLALLLSILGIVAARRLPIQLFLLTYLLAVVLGLMAGSYLFKPMYQGARHIMLGSPALILMMAWGLVWLWQHNLTGRRRLDQIIALGITAVFLSGPLLSLTNYYTDPQYAKDDFRQLIHTVERLAGPRDVIVYHNAIILPLHAHYQTRADLGVTAMPIYPTRADDTAVAQLQTLIENYDRLWFITDPPADQRDANNLVPQLLAQTGQAVDQYPVHARTTELAAIVYPLGDSRPTHLPESAQPMESSWDNAQLVGSSPTHSAEASQSAWLTLFWQTPPIDGQTVQIQLLDINGRLWHVENQTVSLPEPTDGLIQQPLMISLPPGLPPGAYTPTIRPTNEEMAVELPLLIRQTAVSAPSPARPRIQWQNGIALAAMELADTRVKPGNNLPLTLFWSTDQPVDPRMFVYELELVGADGTVLRTQTDTPVAEWLQMWPPDVLLREGNGLFIRPETAPGTYQLRWQLTENGEPINGRSGWLPWPRQTRIQTGEIVVEPWPLTTELPPMETAVSAQFGDTIFLRGYDIAQAERTINLTLYWQAVGPFANNYLLFVHLVDADGTIVAQVDRLPGNGLRPLGSWRPDEVLSDSVTLQLPADAPAGDYFIRVGFFESATFARLPVVQDGLAQPDNQLNLLTVTLP